MYENFMRSKKRSAWQWVQYLALGTIALLLGARFSFASASVHKQLDGAAMVAFGIGAFAARDKWCLTELRHILARVMGWMIVVVFAGALIIGGCLEFVGR
jgi:hypothetical protein